MSAHLKLKTRVTTAVVVLANVLGNFFMSLGMKRHGALPGSAAWEYIRVLFDPLVALGVSLLVVWLLSRMALLSWADLSYVLPVTAAGYVLSAVAGKVFLGEIVTPVRWCGTLLIVGGVVLVGTTKARTTSEPKREAPLVGAGREQP